MKENILYGRLDATEEEIIEAAKKALMTPKEVAKIAYRDFKKGKLIIIPGFKNKLVIMLNKFIPRSLSRKIILMMNKG